MFYFIDTAVPVVSDCSVNAGQGGCLRVAVDLGTRGWLEGRQKIEPLRQNFGVVPKA